jgi:hypothetical protein
MEKAPRLVQLYKLIMESFDRGEDIARRRRRIKKPKKTGHFFAPQTDREWRHVAGPKVDLHLARISHTNDP